MNMKKPLVLVFCAAALSFGVVACGSDDEEPATSSAATEMESTSNANSEPMDSGNEAAMGSEDIVALAQANPDLSTLVKAVGAADLVSTLQGDGPFTVFAPTNEAFEALPPAELNRLLKLANKDELANILTYHVVAGDVKAADLKDGQMVETVQGGKVKVTISENGKVKIGDATVVMPDVAASNGTVHVIDTVLLPSN